MATIIPRTGPTVQLERAPTVRNTTMVDTSAAQRAAQQIGGVATAYLEKKQEENDVTAVMKARRELSDWEASTFDPQNPEGITKFRGQNALGANDALVPDLDKRVGEIGEKLTPRQRQQFDAVATNFRDQVQGRLNGHMDREHSAYLSAEQKATLENLGQDAVAAAVAGDFGRQDTIANELLAINRARRTSEGMGEELIKAEERGIVSTVRKQSIDSMMTMRPFEAQAYYERYADQMTPEDRAGVERALYPVVMDAEITEDVDALLAGVKPPNAGTGSGAVTGGEVHDTFDAAMVSLGPTEGGFQNDPDDKGNYRNGKLVGTKFGISARAHPDVDIANLTQDQARAIYKREYWDAIDADKLPPELRGAAFDAAVNNGVPTAKRWLAAADGDLAKFQAMRRGRMRAIQSNDPTQRKWAGGWGARVDKFDQGGAGAAPAQPSKPPTEAEALAQVRSMYRDPRQRSAAQAKVREHFQLQDMREAEAEKAMSEHTYTSINQAANPALPLRAIIGAEAYAYAERKGQVPALENQRKAKLMGTLTQDDPVMVDAFQREAVLSPNTFAKRNLYDPKVVDRMSTDTLAQMLKMQKDAKDPVKRAEWATQQERIDSGLRVLGLDAATDPTDKGEKKVRDTQRAAFGLFYREAERAFVQKSGKAPTPAEADALIRQVTRNVAEDIPGKLARAGSVEGYSAALGDSDRQEIIADFRASLGREPTEAEIVNIAARYQIQARK